MFRSAFLLVLLSAPLAVLTIAADPASTPTAAATSLRIEAKRRGGWAAWPAHQLAAYADLPVLRREQTFAFTWPEVSGLPNAFVTARINLALRQAGGAEKVALPRAGAPLPAGDGAPLDDTIDYKILVAGPEVLSVVFQRWTRHALDANGHQGNIDVFHFDLRTGDALTLQDLIVPGGLTTIAAAIPKTEDAESGRVQLQYFNGLKIDTPVYFADGQLHVGVNLEAGSSAGEGAAFCAVPLDQIRAALSTRGLALAEASKTPNKK